MVSFKKIRNGALSELIAHKKNRVVSILLLAFAGLFYGFRTTAGRDVYPSGMAIFLYGAALICLFSACVNVFKDMHDIPSADVQMSMPLNSTERYFSRLLAVVYIWVLPFVISAACAILLSSLIAPLDENYSLYGNYNYNKTLATSADVAVYDLKLLLGYIEVVLYIIAATVISQCCVGSKAESKYMPILLMLVLTVLPMTVYSSIGYKFVANINYSTVRLLSNTLLTSVIDSDDSAKEYIFSAVKSIIYLALIVCGVLIYKKRDARSVGRPIVFTAFFEIVMGLSLLQFFTVAHIDGIFSFTALFFAWLGSIILRVISSRKEFSFKKIFRWSGLYLVYYAAFLMFMFIAFKTGGFGALYDIPTVSELKNDSIDSISVKIYTPDDTPRWSYARHS